MRPEDLYILQFSLQDSCSRLKSSQEIADLAIVLNASKQYQQNPTPEQYKEFLLNLVRNGSPN